MLRITSSMLPYYFHSKCLYCCVLHQICYSITSTRSVCIAAYYIKYLAPSLPLQVFVLLRITSNMLLHHFHSKCFYFALHQICCSITSTQVFVCRTNQALKIISSFSIQVIINDLLKVVEWYIKFLEAIAEIEKWY